MKIIEEKILREGKIINNDIIKVDSFLNHQIDVPLIHEFAQEVREWMAGRRVDKILTIEASGIAIAYAVAEQLGAIPLVFAKKSKSATVDDNVYKSTIKSFTRNVESEVTVAKPYLKEGERILIVDDFLAEGNAAFGLINICNQAKARVLGLAAVVEKRFQGGRERLEKEGYDVFAGASIKEFKDNVPIFY